MEQFVGIDWGYGRARWCAKASDGTVLAEDWATADEDGLARLAARLGPEVKACVEDDERRRLGAGAARGGRLDG